MAIMTINAVAKAEARVGRETTVSFGVALQTTITKLYAHYYMLMNTCMYSLKYKLVHTFHHECKRYEY